MKRIVVVQGGAAMDHRFVANLVAALRGAGCEVEECGADDAQALLDALAQGSVPVVINQS